MSTQTATAAESNFAHDAHDNDTRDHDNAAAIHPAWEKPTPLPKFQIFILTLIQFAEPITGLVIYPFINKLIRETGVTNGDERRTGYYAGIIESAFFFAEAVTVIQWGYLSDRFGRRPVLLLGPLGLAVSMFIFGASTKFVPLVLSRCFQGIFNGNIGVTKSMIVEITDASNIGDAYALVPLIWSVGSTIAPIIGGVLSNPATRWPDTLGQIHYLRHHPYFLPCATSGFLAFATFIISFFGLKETLPSLVAAPHQRQLDEVSSDNIIIPNATAKTSLINHGERLDYGTTDATERSQSSSSSNSSSGLESNTSSFLTRGLLLIYLNYAALSFLDMGHFVLLPLFYSTSIPLGGLGLDPFRIGVTLGTFGCINAVIQANALGPLIRKYGARKMYIVSFPGLIACFALYPIMRHFAQTAGRVDGFVVACMMIQLSCYICIYIAYGSMQVMLAQHVADSGRMGTSLGIGQMLASGMRSISPVLVSSLFSISLQRDLAGGNLVFYILMGLTLFFVRISHFLPHSTVQNNNRQSQPSA
ncbi:major facilitator superfamily multidrug-resistance, DHA1 sub-family [Phlegmacium glaucopus]|nr:major facilitator superfamily multidrug-resistance, DHA1 sub-family [Phlegmacium glaucopus]